jgi:uncharacterized protein DUF4352
MYPQQPPEPRRPYYQQPHYQQPPDAYQQPPGDPYQNQEAGPYQQQSPYPQGYPPQGYPPHPPYQQPPRKSWPRRHKVLTGLFALVGLFVVIGIASAIGSGGNSGGNAGTTSSGTGQGVQNTGTTATAGIGDKVRDGKFQFVITRISHAKSVGDVADGLGNTAQGEYTILHITVTNIGSESQTLDDGSQYVYDAAGRKFSASSDADIDLSGANGQNSTWLDDINPGNTVHGRIAFDLPAGDKAMKAELHDSMFSGGVTVSLTR